MVSAIAQLSGLVAAMEVTVTPGGRSSSGPTGRTCVDSSSGRASPFPGVAGTNNPTRVPCLNTPHSTCAASARKSGCMAHVSVK